MHRCSTLREAEGVHRINTHRVRPAKVCGITRALTSHDIPLLRDDGMEAATVTVRAEGHAPASGISFPSTSPRQIQPSPVPHLQSDKSKSFQHSHDLSFQSLYSNGLLIGLHFRTSCQTSGTKQHKISSVFALAPLTHLNVVDVLFLSDCRLLKTCRLLGNQLP